ncbi:MAG: DUF2723 domain-containing protein [Elusimicrobia bacterium]|nr:DUF2723 domain-containing protein [Elusimicrobiota bacterium]
MCLVFLVSFFFYIVTLYPTVSVGDSGELITAAYTLGIPHPPGYPLWTILGKIFTIIIPFGNIAYRVNLMSAFFGALSCSIIYLVTKQISGLTDEQISDSYTYPLTRLPAKDSVEGLPAYLLTCLPALILAFSNSFWSQSVIAEVYTLNAFFVVLLIYLVIYFFYGKSTPLPVLQSKTRGEHPIIYLFAFIYGISVANHFIMFLFVPVFFIYLIWQNPKYFNLKIIILLIAISLFGLLLYIYLPIRSLINPPIDWGNPENLKNFIAHVGRFQYKGMELAAKVSLTTKLLYVKNIFVQSIQNFGIGFVIISIIGLYILVKENIKFAVLTILIFLANTVGLIIALNFKFTPQDIDAFIPYYLPAWIVVSIWIGFGIFKLVFVEKGTKINLATKSLILILLVLQLVANFKKNYNRYNFIAYDYPVDILKSVPKRSILYLQDEVDETIFTLSYVKNVLKKRQDVTVIDSYNNVFLPKFPGQKTAEYYSTVNIDKIKKSLVLCGLIWTVNKKAEGSPWVFYSGRIPEKVENYREQEVVARYPYFYGKFLMVSGKQKEGFLKLKESLETGPDLIWLNNNVGNIFRQNEYFDDAGITLNNTIHLDSTYSPAYYNLGLLFLQKKETDKAIEYFKKAYQYDKTDADSLSQISKIYQNNGYKYFLSEKLNEAINEYKKAMEYTPSEVDIYYNIGVIYSRLNDNKNVRQFFEKYLEINPGGKNAETIRKWLATN